MANVPNGKFENKPTNKLINWIARYLTDCKHTYKYVIN
jgi:hypothetical protein